MVPKSASCEWKRLSEARTAQVLGNGCPERPSPSGAKGGNERRGIESGKDKVMHRKDKKKASARRAGWVLKRRLGELH